MLTKVNVEKTISRIMSTDPVYEAKLKSEMAEGSKKITKIQDSLAKRVTNNSTVTGLLNSVRERRTIYISTRDEIFKKKADGDLIGAKAILEARFTQELREYETSIENVPLYYEKQIQYRNKLMDEKMGTGLIVFTILGTLTSLIGIVSIWYIPNSITRPLKEALRIAESVAKGDLSTRIQSNSKDETGLLLSALGTMQENLRMIVNGIHDGTNSIATTSRQILHGNMELTKRTETTARVLEETASSMVELASTVQNTADTAGKTSQGANIAAETTKRGGVMVDEATRIMRLIAESSRKITDIISVIDGIAFQTNILALNAAVEAARAGDQGKGFAVVASEVRALAQRSAEAAKEIKTLISDSVERVDIGLQKVDDAGREMKDIMIQIHEVQQMMQAISQATLEQSSGIRSAESAIAQIEDGTERNASLAEEATGAAKSLREEAEKLAKLVSGFKVAWKEIWMNLVLRDLVHSLKQKPRLDLGF